LKVKKGVVGGLLIIEEICTFIEEELHNVTGQEEDAKLEMVVHKGEDYITRGAQI